MKYITPIFLALLVLLVSMFAPMMVPLALLGARWDKVQTTQDGIASTYGDLPAWAEWFATPDARLPGGLYESTVATALQRFGRFLTSWYWLGWRNRAHGLAARFSKPATAEQFNAPENFGFRDYGGGIWQYRKDFRFIKALTFKAGYRVYNLRNGSYIASPCFTVKKA